MNKATVIIQARTNSTRFPRKILKKISGKTILEILIKRLKKSKKILKIIVAGTKNENDKEILKICKKLKVNFYAGDENNVLKRYFDVATKFNCKDIVRVTSDCPFLDHKIMDKIIHTYYKKKLEYCSNTLIPYFADGQDVEIFSYTQLKKANQYAKNNFEREHVTTYIKKNSNIKKFNVYDDENLSQIRITIDEPEDLIVLKNIYNHFKSFNFSYKKIKLLYKKNKKLFETNSNIKRNMGSITSTGQKMWNRAKKIIPGGTMLFSKNPDLQLPSKWPVYFKKSRGYSIWDLDNKKYSDLFSMGIGTNTLGYSHPLIDKKVLKTIANGNMTSLNSTEEIHLAERLISMHSWADQVRFTRSGGEANAVAIRIARAYSGKDKIAVCGYHGWHDWYLSTNLNNKKNLNNHLLKNLSVDGVPKVLKKSVFTFDYNDFHALKKIIETEKVGIIKMEVERDHKPTNNFLQKVRKIANEKKIILIFDECTSGFRECFGGLHLKYKVNPDIAIFGKALGNGYAINAILGKKEIMQSINTTFISSTFWTERIGPTAALETLNVMEKEKSWEKITKIGRDIKKNWRKMASENSLDINVSGLDAMPKIYFKSKLNNEYKTFISQEMLKKEILASNVIYTCTKHDKKILNKYYDVLNEIFKKIKKCENGEESISKLLKTPTCISNIRDA